jgi:peptide-methionine (S)-S-oxide reductase
MRNTDTQITIFFLLIACARQVLYNMRTQKAATVKHRQGNFHFTYKPRSMPMTPAKSWFIFIALTLVVLYLGSQWLAFEPASMLKPSAPPEGLAQATFGAGCFWCTEAVFQQLNGVHTVVSGYSGGSLKNPTYRQICTGKTGHAEVIQIGYDPAVISFEELLQVFWQTHDPTTLNRQGNDVGTQYRSAIFYHTDEQKRLAEHYKQKLDAAGVFNRPIVTEIVPFTEFYRAETDHQNYYADNAGQGYCRFIIRPKLEKMKKVFQDKLKPQGN